MKPVERIWTFGLPSSRPLLINNLSGIKVSNYNLSCLNILISNQKYLLFVIVSLAPFWTGNIYYFNSWSGLNLETEELKHLVKQDDNEAYRRLFEAYYRKTYAVAYNILRSRESAEDITQDAFIKAFQNLNQLKDATRFGAWVAVIASNLARNYLKREKKVLYTDEEAIISGVSEASYTEDAALRTLDIDKVREAIKKLPPEQYQLIVLQYYYDLRVEDIAAMLKLRVGTVKSRLHRARRRLAENLELIDDSVCLLSEGGEREQ